MNIFIAVQSVDDWARAYSSYLNSLQQEQEESLKLVSKHYPEDKRDTESVTMDLFGSYLSVCNKLGKQAVLSQHVPLDEFNRQIFSIDCYIGFKTENVKQEQIKFMLPKWLDPANNTVSSAFNFRLNNYFKLESIPMNTTLDAYWVSDIPEVHKFVAKCCGVKGNYLQLSRFRTNTVVTSDEVHSVCKARFANLGCNNAVIDKEIDFNLPASLLSLLLYLPTAGLL